MGTEINIKNGKTIKKKEEDDDDEMMMKKKLVLVHKALFSHLAFIVHKALFSHLAFKEAEINFRYSGYFISS
jgi:hypothetical protein